MTKNIVVSNETVHYIQEAYTSSRKVLIPRWMGICHHTSNNYCDNKYHSNSWASSTLSGHQTDTKRSYRISFFTLKENVMEMEKERESVLYLKKLRPYFTERDIEEIKTGYAFSKYGHRNQTRDSGERYFDHPKEVSLIVFNDFDVKFDWKVIVIALLHDIVEDQYLLTERRIWINFKSIVAQGVKFVSKDEDSKEVFFPRLFSCNQWRPMVVKLADRIHNMRTLDTCALEKQKKQVEETQKYYFQLCDISGKTIPKQYRHAIVYARAELNRLCELYDG